MSMCRSVAKSNKLRGELLTASDEKDRYGDEMRLLDKARENQWAAERDNELLIKLRRQAEGRAATARHHGKAPRAFNRILCPIDFDENSFKSLDLAGRLASENDADVYVLYVCSPVFVPLGNAVSDR